VDVADVPVDKEALDALDGTDIGEGRRLVYVHLGKPDSAPSESVKTGLSALRNSV
jgi:hypothetical protein